MVTTPGDLQPNAFMPSLLTARTPFCLALSYSAPILLVPLDCSAAVGYIHSNVCRSKTTAGTTTDKPRGESLLGQKTESCRGSRGTKEFHGGTGTRSRGGSGDFLYAVVRRNYRVGWGKTPGLAPRRNRVHGQCEDL